MREVPFLKTLEEHGVPVTDDTRERMEMFISRMKNEPGSKERLEKYAAEAPQAGGSSIPIPVVSSKDDFLGPEVRWVVEVLGSPYMQIFIRMLFTVLFFVSYLEKIPVFGGILSAVLDLMITGGRVLIKMVQRFLPPVIGLVPLPFMGIVGMVFAGVFGMLVWPVVAIISFSRQEFTTAIEAMFRALPPPVGDTVADSFLDMNRTAYRMNEKRKQLVTDIVAGLKLIMDVGENAKDKVSSGADVLTDKLTQIVHGPTNLKDKASGVVGDLKEKSSGLMGNLKEKSSGLMGDMKEKSSGLMGKLSDMKEKSSGFLGNLKEKSSGLMGKFKGGQSLSRKPRKKNKWRTRRQPTK